MKARNEVFLLCCRESLSGWDSFFCISSILSDRDMAKHHVPS